MREFRIEPLIGVGPIRFGMSRREVEAHVGMGTEISATRSRYLDALFVDFDDTGRAEFIEAGQSSQLTVVLAGTNLHAVTVEEAVRVVATRAPYDTNDPELGYSYVFPKLQLVLWRDSKERKHFESVAVARPGYYVEAG